jgi:uncharacterized RDD family membrane protein YckC
VRTAEGVELRMPIAGPAPRMLAYAIDWCLLWVAIMLFFITVLLLVPTVADWAGNLIPSWTATNLPREPERALLPFIIVFIIVEYFGELLYFVFWETVTGGSSPGKRLVGLRVVKLDGLEVDLRASSIRNLLRAADVLPSSYLVGLTSMLISSRSQRLGDLAAGTLVVRLDTPERAVGLSLPPGLLPLPLSRAQMQKLSDAERALVRGALRRSASLQGDRREAVLRTATTALCAKLELDPDLASDALLFLRRLWLTMQQSQR